MIKYKEMTLAKKLTFLTIILCSMGSFAVLFFVNATLQRLSDKYLESELSSRKKIITQIYQDPLWNFDLVQIVQLSKSFLINNDFAYIMAIKITKPNGEILFNDSTLIKKFDNFNDHLQLPYTKLGKIMVEKKEQPLATIDIIFTNEGFMIKFKEILIKFLIVTFFIILLTSFWIYIYFSKYLSNPLNQLLEHIYQIEKEVYTEKSYKKLPHELTLIANALNLASKLIKKRNDDLKNHTDNLEKTVELRTRELEKQIVENVNAQRLVAVGEMAAGIAHEINNPLTIILGQILKIKKQTKGLEIEADISAPLEKSTMMIDRISKIINGLKTISRNGKSDPMNLFKIHPLIEEIKILCDMKIRDQNIDLSISIDQEVTTVYGREVQISQVLVNLINNSVDAIAELEERWVNIEIKAEDQEMVVFLITDSGQGIPPAVCEKIMSPFFTTKEFGKGTGLGLSLSKDIVKEHGGEMYYNDKCKNTQFIFTLHKNEIKNLLKEVA